MNIQVMSSEEATSVPSLPRATIYLVDPDQDTRMRFAEMCESIDCELVTFDSIARFTNAPTLVRPACLACDLSALKQSGLDLQSKMQARDWNVPVLFLSDHRDIDVATEVTTRGGWTLIRKPVDSDKVDHLFVSATETDRRNVELESLRSSAEEALSRLTERQLGVLQCVVEGMPTRMIARQYGVSTRLIELERSELLKAFGVPTTPDLTLKMGEYRVLERVLMRNDHGHNGFRDPQTEASSGKDSDDQNGSN
jgi:FixJ family two-component response regulator